MEEKTPVLFGSYRRPLDAKGRLVIPNQLRSGLEDEEPILVKWFDNSLALFPRSRWLTLAEAVHRLPSFSQKDRRMRRAFFGSAVPMKPDTQGRASIPEEMRKYAFLDGEVILIGDFDKIELWSPALYQAEERTSDAEINSTFEYVLSRALNASPSVSEADKEQGSGVSVE